MRNHRPEFIGWGITSQCNLSCPHCYSPPEKDFSFELSTGECCDLIDDLIMLGVHIIGWTGGEPLLRDDFEDIVRYAGRRGEIISGVTTNGVLLDEERAKSLKEAGISFIQISLDGSTPERNHKIRRASHDDFVKIIEGIRTSRELGLKVHMAMLVGEENLDDVRDFITLAMSEGVKSLRFCCFVPSGRGKLNAVQKRLLFSDRLPELKKLVEEFSGLENPIAMFDPGFGPLPPDYYFHPCISGVKTFYINSIGNVYPCTSLLDDKFLVGNVRKSSLAELWENPKMIYISSLPRNKIHGFCGECDYFQVCKGGCRGIVYSHTGDLFASYPNCLSRV